MTSMAEKWMGSRGMDSGNVWQTDDGEDILDLLAAEKTVEQGALWLAGSRVDAYHFADGSAVIATEAWWDLVVDGKCEAGQVSTSPAAGDR